jgi:hypothetical protein
LRCGGTQHKGAKDEQVIHSRLSQVSQQ